MRRKERQIAKKKLKNKKKRQNLKAKQTEIDKSEKPKELTQITVINKSDVVKKIKNREQTDKEKDMILDNIEDKFVKKELMRQRQEEIQKRKYSYFSRKNNVKEEERVKAKQFFDESSIKKTFKKNNEKFEKNSGNKKKLEKNHFKKIRM